MRTAILDPFSGISGDMTLGALIGVGLEQEWLRALPDRMGLPDVRVDIREVLRGEIVCWKVEFDIPPQPHGRHIGQIRELGKQACVVLNPHTPLESIEWVLRDVQQVLVMSVNPGFGGQAFIPSALEKITRLRRMIDERGYKVEIEVDGGVKVDNIDLVVKAGANVIVSGSGVFGTKDYAATIAELRKRGEAARVS